VPRGRRLDQLAAVLPHRPGSAGAAPDHPGQAALLHSVRSRRAEASTAIQNQIIKASSSNATVSRRIAGSSTASS
jgi:hypothetical protein